MENAQDLMIENYVTIDGKICEVVSISNRDLECHSLDKRSIYHYPIHHLQGIPLTPELLLKLGFEQGRYEWKKNEFQKFVHGDCYLTMYHNFKENTFSSYYGSRQSTSGADCFIDTQYRIADIEYLHQMQNVFYTLTGQSLTVKFE